MSVKNDDGLLHRAIKTFGHQNQIEIAKEELAELIVALSHNRRDRCSNDQVASEIADVLIMCEQLKIMFGTDRVQIAIDEKLERLKGRIEDQENTQQLK